MIDQGSDLDGGRSLHDSGNASGQQSRRSRMGLLGDARIQGAAALLGVFVALGAWQLPKTASDDPGPEPPGVPGATVETSPSSQESVTPSSSTVTKDDYIKAADEICMVAYQRNGDIVKEYGVTLDGLVQRKILFENLVVQWTNVERPTEGDAQIRAILEDFRQGNRHMAEAITAHQSGDANAYDQAWRTGEIFYNRSNAAAREYGHRVCGNYE